MKQTTFASLSYDAKKKQTRRERFLLEMEQVVPWEALCGALVYDFTFVTRSNDLSKFRGPFLFWRCIECVSNL